jgi:transposase
VTTGRVVPADRGHLRVWLERFADSQQVAFALEGCTGWRYVVEELQRAGIAAHLAEPAETAGLRGPKGRAKTDRADARHLRELLGAGRLPASWIPPTHVLEARATIRLYKDLLDERTAWLQRVHATLFHQGVPVIAKLTTPEGTERLAAAELSAAGRQAVAVGLRQIQRRSEEMAPLRAQLADLSARQVGCRALREAHYGVGALTSVAIWAELGDCRRFGSSDDAVCHTGLDITVYASDGKRTKGHLARQGPAVLRWALSEAAVFTGRASSPDHAYFQQVKQRLDGQRALLSVARKLARRCYHTLRGLGDRAFARRRSGADPADGAPQNRCGCDQLLQPCRGRLRAGPPTKTERSHAPVGHPIAIMSPESSPSTEISLGARTADPSTLRPITGGSGHVTPTAASLLHLDPWQASRSSPGTPAPAC